MGLGYGTDFKKDIVEMDRLYYMVKGQLVQEVANRGLTWSATGKDSPDNEVIQSRECVAYVVDYELMIRSLWYGDEQDVPLERLGDAFVQKVVGPFTDEDGVMKKLVVVSFDNSALKPLCKAGTSTKRAEDTVDIKIPDELIPNAETLRPSTTVPSLTRVMATPAFKSVLYNYLLQRLYDHAKALEVHDNCGLIVTLPCLDQSIFSVEGLDPFSVETQDQPPESLYFLTGDHVVFTRESPAVLREIASRVADECRYGEADVLLRNYCDYIQLLLPECFVDPGTCIVAHSKDSDSLPIFVLTDPGAVILLMGTVSDSYLTGRKYERDEKKHAFFIFTRRFRDCLRLSEPAIAAQFAVACVMAGTDYVVRIKDIGAATMFKSLMSWSEIPQSAKPTDTIQFLSPKRGASVVTKGPGKAATPHLEDILNALRRGAKKNALANISKVNDSYFKRVLWNIRYWYLENPETGGPDPLTHGWHAARPNEKKGYWPDNKCPWEMGGEIEKGDEKQPALHASGKKPAASEGAEAEAPKQRRLDFHDDMDVDMLPRRPSPASGKKQAVREGEAAEAPRRRRLDFHDDSDEDMLPRPPPRKPAPVKKEPLSGWLTTKKGQETTEKRPGNPTPSEKRPAKPEKPTWSVDSLDWSPPKTKEKPKEARPPRALTFEDSPPPTGKGKGRMLKESAPEFEHMRRFAPDQDDDVVFIPKRVEKPQKTWLKATRMEEDEEFMNDKPLPVTPGPSEKLRKKTVVFNGKPGEKVSFDGRPPSSQKQHTLTASAYDDYWRNI